MKALKRKTGESNLDPDHPADSRSKEAPAHRQRQPQTSCDFCRLKKLKCDRAQPCSTCVTRGRPCDGPPVPVLSAPGTSTTNTVVSTSTGPDPDRNILDRLRSLEEAVFGASRHRDGSLRLNQQTPPTHIEPNPKITTVVEHQVPNSQIVDLLTTCDLLAVEANYANFRYRFAQPVRLNGGLVSDDLPGQDELHSPARNIWLPSKEGSHALLHDYIQWQHLFLGVIDPRATRDLVDHIYSRLERGKRVGPAHVALLLSIAATVAFFWDKNDSSTSYQFSTETSAANWSVFWRNSSWDLLDQVRREVTGSLEELQATIILGHLISQIEGCPSRYRRLQGNALTIAREISLHVIDAPGAIMPWDRQPELAQRADWQKANDDEAVREIKRRVWWHLVGTDWLLSVMGGPLYKSYTVNPLHMRVRYPRNIDDSDLHKLTPWPKGGCNEWPDTRNEIPTTATYALLRLRVAEICYKIVDALQPIAYSQSGNGGDGIEQLPYEEIFRISQLFDDVLNCFPPSYMLGAPIPPGAPPNLDMQRQVLLLYFHARRARAFRCFLHSSTTAGTISEAGNPGTYRSNGGRQRDPRYERFAALCRDSARTVLAIASSLVSKSLTAADTPDASNTASRFQQQPQQTKLVHRSGLVLMHLFMACVILATDPTLSPNASATNYDADSSTASSDAAARRAELAQACYILKQASEKSAMATGLVDSLMYVLKRHKLRVFCNKGRPDCEPHAATNNSSHPPVPSSPLNTTTSTAPTPFGEQTTSHQLIPITSNFVAANLTDRDTVNDIWGIDQIQARLRAQHARARQQAADKQQVPVAVQLPDTPSSTLPHISTQEANAANQPYGDHFPSPAETELLPLDGLWKDLIDAAAAGDGGVTDGVGLGQGVGVGDDGIQWEQLFADLDYFLGPS